MQFGVTWSPDVQFIAYSSDRGGKFDIWVQQVVAINPVKITSRAGHNWQPDWVYPFDAMTGRFSPSGRPVTPVGVDAWMPDLSRDGKKLLYVAQRAGKWELWEKLLENGQEILLANDGRHRGVPRWSPDGKRLSSNEWILPSIPPMLMPAGGGEEEPVTSKSFECGLWDWSPDGDSLLASHLTSGQERWWSGYLLISLPLSAAPLADTHARLITSSRTDGLFEPHFSPDGRWVVFEAVKGGVVAGDSAENAALYVVAASGGTWIPITDGKSWDDKPR